MSERVLICGGAGFIGSSLAVGLKRLHPDWEMTALDNLRRRGSELSLTRLRAAGVSFVHGDIRCAADLDPQALAAGTIVDCSAEPSVLAGFSSPDYVLQTNLVGTMHILELARQVGARLLFLSSSRVYPVEPLKAIALEEQPSRFAIPAQTIGPGLSPAGIAEAFPLDGYRSLYGSTKLASELLIEEYRQAYGLSAIINRCGVVTGPWQMGKVDQGVFALWVAAHHFKKSLSYIGYGGSGKQVRDMLHVEDLLSLVDYQLTHFDACDGDVLNVGGGVEGSLSLLETTRLCEKITGNQIPIQPVEADRPGDIPLFIMDSTQLRKKTGWQPKYTCEQVLASIYEWILQYEDELRPILT